MPDFYYQIKGRRDDGSFSDWHWPPLLSGKVTAENKKAARKCVEELHGQSFPMRVKQEDKDKFLYLLNIREIAPDDTRTQEYFDEKKCPQCDSTFKLIDIYNDGLRTPGGRDFCSHTCLAAYRERERTFDPTKQDDELGRHAAFIYRIYNLVENKSYIGQTKQAFTLRWYQHFYQGTGTPFHTAIANSQITDWQFSIVERVDIPDDVTDVKRFVDARERHWIDAFDTINNGYNTMSIAQPQVTQDQEISK